MHNETTDETVAVVEHSEVLHVYWTKLVISVSLYVCFSGT